MISKKIIFTTIFASAIIVQSALADTCYTFNYNLSLNSRLTKDVTELQNFLLSYNGGSLVNSNTYIRSGKYDKYTAAIVKTFQRQQDISPTGTLGPTTRKAINAIYSCNTNATSVSTTPVVKNFSFNSKTWDRAYVNFYPEIANESFPYYATYYYKKGENIANYSEYIYVEKVVKARNSLVPNVFNEATNLGYSIQESEDYVVMTKPTDVRGDGKEFVLSYLDTSKKTDPVFVVVRMYQKGDSVIEIFYVLRTNALPEIKALADVYKSKLNYATTTWTAEELQARVSFFQNVDFAMQNKEREIIGRFNTEVSSIPTDQDVYSPREKDLGDLRYNQ